MQYANGKQRRPYYYVNHLHRKVMYYFLQGIVFKYKNLLSEYPDPSLAACSRMGAFDLGVWSCGNISRSMCTLIQGRAQIALARKPSQLHAAIHIINR
jgi:hypothetical protein